MKIAALSDIHGNLSALDAVLADVRVVEYDWAAALRDGRC